MCCSATVQNKNGAKLGAKNSQKTSLQPGNEFSVKNAHYLLADCSSSPGRKLRGLFVRVSNEQ